MPNIERAVFFLLLLSAMAGAIAADENPAHRWNLGDLYASTALWNADSAKVEAQLNELGTCSGHLGDGAARFAACLDLSAAIRQRYARLAVYAAEFHNEDTGAAAGLELGQRADL
jgi:oligoendopeptidase F